MLLEGVDVEGREALAARPALAHLLRVRVRVRVRVRIRGRVKVKVRVRVRVRVRVTLGSAVAL